LGCICVWRDLQRGGVASANPDAAFSLAYLTAQAATKIFIAQGFEVLPK